MADYDSNPSDEGDELAACSPREEEVETENGASGDEDNSTRIEQVPRGFQSTNQLLIARNEDFKWVTTGMSGEDLEVQTTKILFRAKGVRN